MCMRMCVCVYVCLCIMSVFVYTYMYVCIYIYICWLKWLKLGADACPASAGSLPSCGSPALPFSRG